MTSAGTDASPRLWSGEHRALVLGLVGVVVGIAFEGMAVATAMPVAARELDGVRSYGLAFSLFLTTSLVGMVLAGAVADRRGPVGPFVASAIIFVAGLVIAGSARSMEVLIVGRAVQGLGAGLSTVALFVVVGRAFPDTLRPRVFSALSGAWVVPALVGPPIAGALADHASWRWVFFAVVPFTVSAVLVVLPRVRHLDGSPDAPAADQGSGAPPQRRRLVAAVGTAVGAGLLQYAGEGLGRLPGVVGTGLAVTGLVLLVVSVPHLLPRGTLRLARGLPTIVAARGVFSGAFFGAETFVPLMLVQQRGLSTAVAGLTLTGAALTWSLGSWLQGRPNLPVPRVRLVSGGLLLVAAGIGIIGSAVLAAVPPGVAALGWLVAGLGMGLGITSVSVLLLEASPVAEQGQNSAALQASDALGSVLLIGVSGAVFAVLHSRGEDVAAYLVIFALTAGCAVLGALAAPRAAA